MTEFMPLADAAEMFGLTAATLRKNRDAGRLKVYRLGGKDFTTLDDMHEMIRLCRVPPKVPACSSGPQDPIDPPRMSSSIGAVSTALAAARTIAEGLRYGSPGTSRESIHQAVANGRFPTQSSQT
jgi:hypothetical protein